MAHVVVPEAEEILDKPFKVLDKGFVRLVDYLGGDARIVQSARVSYGPGTKTIRQDRGLINYLMRNQHTSPFEQVILTFHAKLPIFVARQWVRHRTARLNEMSARYSIMEDEFYLPTAEDVRFQSTTNRQGSSHQEVPKALQGKVLQLLKEDQGEAYAHYQDLLNDNVARELARINLPVSLYTEWYWQTDLNNLFHFIGLRGDAHAQVEIRRYAEVMGRMAYAVAPMAYEAFEEHVLHAVTFSKTERKLIQKVLLGDSFDDTDLPPARLTEFKDKLWGKIEE